MQYAQRLMSSRAGTIALSGLAAALAAGIFLVYLKRYRASVNEGTRPLTVLVAKNAIEKGTPGSVIGSEELFQPAEVPKDKVKEGAITDPASLRGQVAADDIYPGQQLTTGDFAGTPADAVTNKITAYERAISVPLDAAHGMLGQIRPGDYVDVLAGFNIRRGGETFPVLRVLVQDVLVMDVPDEVAGAGLAAGAAAAKSVVLRMTDEQAAQVAFAADNGKVWVVARARTGDSQHVPSVITIERLLVGLKPLPVRATLGGENDE